MSTATKYSLEGKNLKLTSREDIQPYIEQLNEIEDLQEIHLGGNTFGIGACQALGEVLQEKKNLKIANFADIFTGRLISEIPEALRALCNSLVDHTALVEINLSDNAFGGRSAEPMVHFLTHNHHFSILKLNNNGLGIQGGKIVATALIEAAEELKKLNLSSKLKTVICGRNRLEDGSASTWAKAYAAHGNLEEVRMFQNGIRMDGIIAISQGLANCPYLKVLDFQDNTATLRGSRGIASSLSHWANLEVLNLSDCLLKPRGGYLVIDALGKGANSKLKTLQLQYCDLDRKALDRLAGVIDSGAIKELEKLDINGNWADEEDECIEKIKKGLSKFGHEDGLDELDEMDPDGEDDEEEVEDEGAESEEDEGEAKAKEVEPRAEKSESSATETAAAAIAVPAASAAVAGSGLAAAAAVAKDSADSKAQELDLASAVPKEADKQEFAETKNVEEVFGDSAAVETGTSTKEDIAMADNAAEVAEKAQEVPEESVAAQTAAEVSQSAEAVHAKDAKEQTEHTNTAQVADEVAEEARQAGVGGNKEADEVMAKDEADRQGVAGAAAEVAETAQVIHANDEKADQSKEDELTSMMSQTQISQTSSSPKAVSKHPKSGSVDLSGELYAGEAGASNGQYNEAEQAPKKKSAFRAAFGAVRELLR